MKTKLLKKLRSEANWEFKVYKKKHNIFLVYHDFYSGHVSYSKLLSTFSTEKDAIAYCNYCRIDYILSKVNSMRGRGNVIY